MISLIRDYERSNEKGYEGLKIRATKLEKESDLLKMKLKDHSESMSHLESKLILTRSELKRNNEDFES